MYTCFYAVHADCYGGEQTYDLDEEEDEEEKVVESESESEEEQDREMTSYIADLGDVTEVEEEVDAYKIAECSSGKLMARIHGLEKKKA